MRIDRIDTVELLK